MARWRLVGSTTVALGWASQEPTTASPCSGVSVLDGANELRGRRALAHEWFEGLTAPHKELITYADAGHAVVFEQGDAFLRLMNEQIVPATYGR
jgi:pimeloyl-ACP methyl ester carboxylesterase